MPRYVPTRGPALDAIVVPSTRPARCLEVAGDLAEACRSRLAVLVSDPAKGAEAAQALGPRLGDALLVACVPEGYDHWLTRFATSSHPEAGAACYPDLSVKRNLALLLARLLRWHRVLLLDDDIADLEPRRVRAACALVGGRYRAAGFKVADHPDNSVVCHGSRLAGNWQDTFIGGNALLVDTSRSLPFFPPIYNEDLCFLRPLLEHRGVAQVGVARQIPYDPFDTPARAVGQEFGDVLAEGLLSLIHLGALTSATDRSFWRAQIEGRRALIDTTVAALSDASEPSTAALAALRAARSRLETITPSACATFVDDLNADTSIWEDRLDALPRAESTTDALCALELEPV